MKKLPAFFSPVRLPRFIFPALALAALIPSAAHAVAVSWDGGGADNNWSTLLNWSNDLVPTSVDDLTFGDVDKTTSDTPNSIVTASISVRDLNFTNTGATTSDWHVTQIDAGQTLTVTRNLLVGGATASTTTNVKIQGDGSLTFSGTTFGVRSSANTTLVNLDLSGLASFNATATNFNVGSTTATRATLTLSQANTITATSVTVGNATKNSTLGGQASTLNLGTSNTINADSIIVGGGSSRMGGIIRFADAEGAPTTGGSVAIRGTTGGSSRSNLTIGRGTDGNNAPMSYSVDFTGNTVDARFDNLHVGYVDNSSGSGTSPLTGTFSMDAGTVDATTVTVGNRVVGTAGNATNGILNIGGGTFTAGSIVIGQTTATTATSNGTLNVTGGTVTVNGNIAEGTSAGGAINSTVTLTGGTLDLTGNSLTVDTFTLGSGTLKNLGQFNAGAALVKTTEGALILDGTNSYSGNTSVGAGSLTLADAGSLTFYIGANGITNKVTGAGTATFNGTFAFDLTNAVLADGNSWTIADVTTQSFSGTFDVAGFSDDDLDNIWTNGAGLSFSEATGILSYSAIPEPSSFALFGGLASLALIGLRRRRA